MSVTASIAENITDTAPWVLYVGYTAVILTTLCLPVQFYALYTHRDDPDNLRSVRPMVAMISAVVAVMWAIYGLRFDAGAIVLAQIPILVGLIALACIYVRACVWSKRLVAGCVLILCVIVLLCVNTREEMLGFSAVVLTVMIWIPTALSGIGIRYSPHQTVQSVSITAKLLPWSMMPRITALTHICWWIYGVGMQDVWLWLASPGVVAFTGMRVWSVYVAKLPIKDPYILAAVDKMYKYKTATTESSTKSSTDTEYNH